MTLDLTVCLSWKSGEPPGWVLGRDRTPKASALQFLVQCWANSLPFREFEHQGTNFGIVSRLHFGIKRWDRRQKLGLGIEDTMRRYAVLAPNLLRWKNYPTYCMYRRGSDNFDVGRWPHFTSSYQLEFPIILSKLQGVSVMGESLRLTNYDGMQLRKILLIITNAIILET